MIMIFIYEYSQGEYITAEHGPRGAILRSVPPQVFGDVHLMPFQEGIKRGQGMPAEQHAHQRRLLLASTLPTGVKEMIASPEFEWVNNFFVRAHDGSFDPRGAGYHVLIR